MDDGQGEDEVVPASGAPGGGVPTGGPPFPHLPPPPSLAPPPATPAAEGLPPIAWVAIVIGLVLPALLGLLGLLVYLVVALA